MNMSGQFFKKTMRDVPLDGKTVLVRADYNVPLEKGEITNDYRITQSVPTIQELRDRGCKVVIISHLGRPKGMIAPAFTLEPVAKRLRELLQTEVKFIGDCIGDRALQATKNLQPGEVILLENLRFHEGEEANDSNFAKQLAEASNAEYFVQDGFGVVHRAHASTEAITHFLPSVAGLLLEKEYTTIAGAMESPEHPFVAILGGAKISDKIAVIERFVQIADHIIIGGAMANTFLKYKGYVIGKSVAEDGLDDVMDKIYAAAAEKVGAENVDDFIVLPTDVAVATDIEPTERRVTVASDEIAEDEYALDIGPISTGRAANIIADAKMIIWNGPLGYTTIPQFAHGSAKIALAMVQNTEAETIIGGGDTAEFVLGWDAKEGASFSHVSTGGGASLDLMSGERLPGIEALMDA